MSLTIQDIKVEMVKPKRIPKWLHKYWMRRAFTWEINYTESKKPKTLNKTVAPKERK